MNQFELLLVVCGHHDKGSCGLILEKCEIGKSSCGLGTSGLRRSLKGLEPFSQYPCQWVPSVCQSQKTGGEWKYLLRQLIPSYMGYISALEIMRNKCNLFGLPEPFLGLRTALLCSLCSHFSGWMPQPGDDCFERFIATLPWNAGGRWLCPKGSRSVSRVDRTGGGPLPCTHKLPSG